MDTLEAIEKRYCYRGEYETTTIDRTTLEKIVHAGIRAPSGYNSQTTSFVIVDDVELVAKVAEILAKPKLATSPALIACVADHRVEHNGMQFAVEDCAAAVENILLAMTALGYSGVWLDGALRREGRAEAIGRLLGVPEDLQVRVLIPVGVPKNPGVPSERKPFEDRAWFNRYREC